MKTQNQGLSVAISQQHLEEMTKEVEESLVSGYSDMNIKSFSAADLWNIQRRGKSAISKRNYVYGY